MTRKDLSHSLRKKGVTFHSVLCGPASTPVAVKVWWCRRGGFRSVPLVTAVLESKRQQPRFCVGVK